MSDPSPRPAPPAPRKETDPAPAEPSQPDLPDLGALIRGERPFLWGLAMRITGSAADADDVVQETFARFLGQPPPDLHAPLRPWLLRVASRVSIDVLRRRRRTPYVGPWLPSPVGDLADEQPSPTARYDTRESLTFGFLLALEALSPQQRAVLVLRDVLDLSVNETATALDMTATNVKVVHLRGRRKLASYDQARVDTSQAAQARVQATLSQLLLAIAQQDVAAVAGLLSPQVVLLNDGGGQYLAARKPVRGAPAVSLFLVKVPRLGGRQGQWNSQLAVLAGQPCMMGQLAVPVPRIAPRFVLGIDVDTDGRITTLYNVLADRKLHALPPADPRP